jgi:alpha-tubulin suppressor-like RCC1 family protein
MSQNRYNTLIPDDVETIRTPSVAKWLDGVALRDLVIHRQHAACVDARGDVYQWGSGFSGSDPGKQVKPTLTLRNKVRDLVDTVLVEPFFQRER